MILGEFENGRPYVSGHIEIPRLAVRGPVRLLVDTGADVTCIHPKDGTPLFIPYEELNNQSSVGGIGGTSPRYLESAILSFRDSVGSPVYRYWIEVRIGKPDDVDERFSSLLGQDILKHWRATHEPALNRVEFVVRTADIIGS